MKDNVFKKVLNDKLVGAALQSGFGFIGNAVFFSLTVKIIAAFGGPSATGLFSLMRQFQQLASTMGSFGGQAFLVQGLASRTEISERNRFLSMAIAYVCASLILVAGGIFILADGIGPKIFPAQSATEIQQSVTLVRWLTVPIALGILVFFLYGMLNAFRQLRTLSYAQVIAAFGSFVVACIAGGLTRNSPMWLVAVLSVGLFASGFFSLLMVLQLPSVRMIHFSVLKDFDLHKKFIYLAGGTLLISGITVGTILLLRGQIAHRYGLDVAGFFDAAWTFSSTYVLIALYPLGTYYLPALSALGNNLERSALISKLYRFAVVTMFPLVILVIVFKMQAIHFLYSNAFSPALAATQWMVVGDFFKVMGWVFAMPMLATADMKSYFLSEVLFNGSLVLLVQFALFRQQDGFLEMFGMGYMVLYALYAMGCCLYCVVRFGFRFKTREAFLGIGSIAAIIVLSRLFWLA